MSNDKAAALTAEITHFFASEDVLVNGWTPEQVAALAVRTLLADTQSLATLSFRPDAYDTAAVFMNLLTPSERWNVAVGRQYVANGDEGYSVHVVTRTGERFDAEVRDVIVDDRDGQYKLVIWPWDGEADRGDRNREMTLDLYDELERIEVF